MGLHQRRRLLLRQVTDDDEDRLVRHILFGVELLHIGDRDFVQRVFGAVGGQL